MKYSISFYDFESDNLQIKTIGENKWELIQKVDFEESNTEFIVSLNSKKYCFDDEKISINGNFYIYKPILCNNADDIISEEVYYDCRENCDKIYFDFSINQINTNLLNNNECLFIKTNLVEINNNKDISINVDEEFINEVSNNDNLQFEHKNIESISINNASGIMSPLFRLFEINDIATKDNYCYALSYILDCRQKLNAEKIRRMLFLISGKEIEEYCAEIIIMKCFEFERTSVMENLSIIYYFIYDVLAGKLEKIQSQISTIMLINYILVFNNYNVLTIEESDIELKRNDVSVIINRYVENSEALSYKNNPVENKIASYIKKNKEKIIVEYSVESVYLLNKNDVSSDFNDIALIVIFHLNLTSKEVEDNKNKMSNMLNSTFNKNFVIYEFVNVNDEYIDELNKMDEIRRVI